MKTKLMAFVFIGYRMTTLNEIRERLRKGVEIKKPIMNNIKIIDRVINININDLIIMYGYVIGKPRSNLLETKILISYNKFLSNTYYIGSIMYKDLMYIIRKNFKSNNDTTLNKNTNGFNYSLLNKINNIKFKIHDCKKIHANYSQDVFNIYKEEFNENLNNSLFEEQLRFNLMEYKDRIY